MNSFALSTLNKNLVARNFFLKVRHACVFGGGGGVVSLPVRTISCDPVFYV
jgi:hypothetical protein